MERGLDKLHIAQNCIVLAYAISLPLSMTISWILLTTAVILLIADLCLSPVTRKQLLHCTPLLLPLMLLITAVAISGAVNGGTGEGLRSVISLKALLSYLVASVAFTRYPKIARNCVAALLIVGAVAGVWGSIQQLFDYHPFGYKYLQGTGFLGGPMPYAGQMQMFSLLALGLLFTNGYRQLPGLVAKTPVFALITFCNVAGLIFAGERSAWLGGIAGIAVSAWLFSWRRFASTIVVLAIVVGLGWATVPIVHTRINALLTPQTDVSSSIRMVIWRRAVREWETSPVFGVGFLKFPHLYAPHAIVPGHSKDLNHAHSNYLQFLSTTGVVGLAAYAWLLLWVLIWSKRLFMIGRVGNVPVLAGYGNGLFAATVSLAIAGIFEYNFGTAQVRLAQWFLLGLLTFARPPVSAPPLKPDAVSSVAA